MKERGWKQIDLPPRTVGLIRRAISVGKIQINSKVVDRIAWYVRRALAEQISRDLASAEAHNEA